MRNKLIGIGTLLAAVVAGVVFFSTLSTDARSKKPDFVTYNQDGSIRTRGVYETDRNGLVTKFALYDDAGRLQYTEVSKHSADGRILSAKRYGPNGQIMISVEYTETAAKVFDAEGRPLETQSFSQQEYLKSQKKAAEPRH